VHVRGARWGAGSYAYFLTLKTLSPWKIISTTKKQVSHIFLHGYIHMLRDRRHAPLDLKNILEKRSYKNFKVFDKCISIDLSWEGWLGGL